jgi:predicted DNA-binding protein
MSKGKKMNDKTISMRISKKTYFQLKCLASEQNKGMSEIVRNLIEDSVPDQLQSELKPKIDKQER